MMMLLGAAKRHAVTTPSGSCSPPKAVTRRLGRTPGPSAFNCLSIPTRDGTEFHTVSSAARTNFTALMERFAGRTWSEAPACHVENMVWTEKSKLSSLASSTRSLARI
jgi:hypothetical protein